MRDEAEDASQPQMKESHAPQSALSGEDTKNEHSTLAPGHCACSLFLLLSLPSVFLCLSLSPSLSLSPPLSPSLWPLSPSPGLLGAHGPLDVSVNTPPSPPPQKQLNTYRNTVINLQSPQPEALGTAGAWRAVWQVGSGFSRLIT